MNKWAIKPTQAKGRKVDNPHPKNYFQVNSFAIYSN